MYICNTYVYICVSAYRIIWCMYSPRGGHKISPMVVINILTNMSSQKATKSFADKAKTARESKNFKGLEELGEPQYHSWAAMIKVALEDTNVEASDRTILEEHFQAVKSVIWLTKFLSLKWSGALTSARANYTLQSSMLSAPWPSRGALGVACCSHAGLVVQSGYVP